MNFKKKKHLRSPILAGNLNIWIILFLLSIYLTPMDLSDSICAE